MYDLAKSIQQKRGRYNELVFDSVVVSESVLTELSELEGALASLAGDLADAVLAQGN